jgi:undecaprenyl-diphosphatase
MRTIFHIDITTASTVLRVIAAVLTGAALLCWARAGSRLVAACLGTVLAILVLEINSGWMRHLDKSAELWVRAHRTPSAVAGWSEIWGYLGDPLYFAATVAVFGGWASWRARSATPVAVMVVAVATGVVLEHALKTAVGRTAAAAAELQVRPSPGSLLNFLHSFPSGHVTVIGTFLGTVAVCLCAGRRVASKVQAAVVVGAVVAAVVVIGVLALYVRAHTLTDVIGGMVLSGAIVAVAGPALSRSVSGPRRVPARDVAGVHRAMPAVQRERVAVG